MSEVITTSPEELHLIEGVVIIQATSHPNPRPFLTEQLAYPGPAPGAPAPDGHSVPHRERGQIVTGG
jgi:hypothetical protein